MFKEFEALHLALKHDGTTIGCGRYGIIADICLSDGTTSKILTAFGDLSDRHHVIQNLITYNTFTHLHNWLKNPWSVRVGRSVMTFHGALQPFIFRVKLEETPNVERDDEGPVAGSGGTED